MGNLKSKVASPELSKKMKKLGWKKRTVFHWVRLKGHTGFKLCLRRGTIFPEVKKDCYHFMFHILEWYSAPLFCEIWEELSIKLSWTANISGGLILEKHIDGTSEMWEINSEYEIQNINPVETAGNLWCQLKENGYIKEE